MLLIFNGSFSPLRAYIFYSVPKSCFTDGRPPWTSDQPVARPLPKRRTTQPRNKRIHTPTFHALCGIPTHDHRVRASEDSSCLRPRRLLWPAKSYYSTTNKNTTREPATEHEKTLVQAHESYYRCIWQLHPHNIFSCLSDKTTKEESTGPSQPTTNT
jgi:hypothetical protein